MTCSQGLRISGSLRIAFAYSCATKRQRESDTRCHIARNRSTEDPLLP
jgi:hypothetical protein